MVRHNKEPVIIRSHLRILLAALLLTLAACGPQPLAGVGEKASEWIGEPTVSTVPTTLDPGTVLVSARSVIWFNDRLTPVAGTTPDEIIAGVYARSSPSDRFAQATALEIATALPGVQFPAQLPPEVRYVTSQLVYDRSTGQLASDQMAAFGLWTVEPYSRSRSVGQLGVLRVVLDPEQAELTAAGAVDVSCNRYPSNGAECTEARVGNSPAWRLNDPEGATLVWFAGRYRYELFTRADVDPALATAMSETLRPLAALVS
jgi:hypothetical protein